MNQGDLFILKNQRKGRYHLEGGYIVDMEKSISKIIKE